MGSNLALVILVIACGAAASPVQHRRLAKVEGKDVLKITMSETPITAAMCEEEEYKSMRGCIEMKRGADRRSELLKGHADLFTDPNKLLTPAEGAAETMSVSLNDGNPCSGPYLQLGLYEVIDFETGDLLDVVWLEDGVQFVYIRLCNQFQLSGLQCSPHLLVTEALVYPYPIGHELEDLTEVRHVVVEQGNCGLSYA